MSINITGRSFTYHNDIDVYHKKRTQKMVQMKSLAQKDEVQKEFLNPKNSFQAKVQNQNNGMHIPM